MCGGGGGGGGGGKNLGAPGGGGGGGGGQLRIWSLMGGGRLVYESPTAEGLFRGEVWTHLLFGENLLHCMQFVGHNTCKSNLKVLLIL